MPRPRTERRLPRPGVARLASESDPGLAAVARGSRPPCSRSPSGRKRTRSQAANADSSRVSTNRASVGCSALGTFSGPGASSSGSATSSASTGSLSTGPVSDRARYRSARCRSARAHWSRHRSAWSTVTARPEPSSSRPSWPDARHRGRPSGGSAASPRGVPGYARESCRAGNGQRPRHDAGSSSTCSEPRPPPCDRRPCTRSRLAHRR